MATRGGKMKNYLKLGPIMIVILLFMGCAGPSRYMRVVPHRDVSYAPKGNEAVVIFMRPTVSGFIYDSCIFDISTEENKLVGIVSANK